MKATKLFLSLAIVLSSVLWLGACTSTPKVTTNYDKTTDFSKYKTFGFFDKLGTDDAQYSTMITEKLKTAVTRELTQKGLTESKNPDLLVNFHTNAETRTDVTSTPSMTPSYYGYRRGYYNWDMYNSTDVHTTHYKVGTLNIDLVDAASKKLVWEGIVEGRLTKSALENPDATINSAVANILSQYGMPTQP